MEIGTGRAAINNQAIANNQLEWHIDAMEYRLINNRVTTTTQRTS